MTTFELSPLAATTVKFTVCETIKVTDVYQASAYLQDILTKHQSDLPFFTDTTIVRAQVIGSATIAKISENSASLSSKLSLTQTVWHNKDPITIKKWQELLKYCLQAENTNSISNSEWWDHMQTLGSSTSSFSEKIDFKDKNNS